MDRDDSQHNKHKGYVKYIYSLDMAKLFVYDPWFKTVPYGKYVKEGDIIELHLDMNKLELSYSVNNNKYGKAFDVDPCSYKIAVSMWTKDSKLKFII